VDANGDAVMAVVPTEASEIIAACRAAWGYLAPHTACARPLGPLPPPPPGGPWPPVASKYPIYGLSSRIGGATYRSYDNALTFLALVGGAPRCVVLTSPPRPRACDAEWAAQCQC
jgi:hypothetical protein